MNSVGQLAPNNACRVFGVRIGETGIYKGMTLANNLIPSVRLLGVNVPYKPSAYRTAHLIKQYHSCLCRWLGFNYYYTLSPLGLEGVSINGLYS